MTKATLEHDGFFCRMSQMETDGNQQRVRWARARFDEGLSLTLLGGKDRGFVEVMPGEHCWRPIHAKRWDVIHCLWVVGRSKGRAKEHGRLGEKHSSNGAATKSLMRAMVSCCSRVRHARLRRAPAQEPTGLVVPQCAVSVSAGATGNALALAKALRVIEFTSARQLRAEAPTPYGVFAIALDGQLLSTTYELPKALAKRAAELRSADQRGC